MKPSVRINVLGILCLMWLPWQPCEAFSSGAPSYRCESMRPGHGSPQPDGELPYSIHLGGALEYVPSRPMTLEIRGGLFRGILIQARRVLDDAIVGVFDDPPASSGLRHLQCTSAGDSITHANTNGKTNLELTWTPPPSYVGTVYFRATVLLEQYKWWLGVISTSLTPGNTTPTTELPSSPATSPPSSTTPSSTPSSTPSITPSSTPSSTPSPTPSSTPSSTPSITPSYTPSPTTPSSTPRPSTEPSWEPTVPPSRTEPTDTSATTEITDPSATTEITDPSATTETTDPSATTETTDPSATTEPTDPSATTEPTDPSDPSGSTTDPITNSASRAFGYMLTILTGIGFAGLTYI